MKLIYRSQTDKKIAGVIGGLAEVYEYDPLFLRTVVCVLGVETFFLPMILLYLLAWVIIPKRPTPEELRTPQAG